MYLPRELDPLDEPISLVVVPARATGARDIVLVTTDHEHAANIARISGAYVLEIRMTADQR